jgi:hypothetical protein
MLLQPSLFLRGQGVDKTRRYSRKIFRRLRQSPKRTAEKRGGKIDYQAKTKNGAILEDEPWHDGVSRYQESSFSDKRTAIPVNGLFILTKIPIPLQDKANFTWLIICYYASMILLYQKYLPFLFFVCSLFCRSLLSSDIQKSPCNSRGFRNTFDLNTPQVLIALR